MAQEESKANVVWKNLSAFWKLIITFLLITTYLFILVKYTNLDRLNSPAILMNTTLLVVTIIYISWQTLTATIQVKDVIWNLKMMKEQPDKYNPHDNWLNKIYLAISMDFEKMSKEYEIKLLEDREKAIERHKEAVDYYDVVIRYNNLLHKSFFNNLEAWYIEQAKLKARLQKALILDLGYIEKNTEVLGKLSKQIKKQYKKLDRLQRKAYWPEYYWLSYIGFLYHDIPHEVSNEELMSRSKAKLEQESFWQELNNKALPQEIVQNVTEYEALITQANKILDEHNL